MKLKLFPFICGFMYISSLYQPILLPLSSRSASPANTQKTLNEFLLLCFIKRRSRIIKKCFFRDLTKAMRKEFHPRPVFLDRVLFFFRFIKNSFFAFRGFYVRMAK
jgi:hypothetical protein